MSNMFLLCPERRVYTFQEGPCEEFSATQLFSINVTISRFGDPRGLVVNFPARLPNA